jgi:tetratricopeptide (TPR) repeat protein
MKRHNSFIVAILAIALRCTAADPAAVSDLKQTVGPESWDKLITRLNSVNQDILTRGLRDFPGAPGKLLTGYPYNEYYDWDLYFENIYLTYYGISDQCFTNLQMFLRREQPDGFISRSLIKFRPQQDFKPFLAQLSLMGSRLRGNDFQWMRADAYDKLKKYLERWFAYDGDHNGLPVWNSADHSGMDNQWSRAGLLNSFQDEGVDLACELVRECRAMSVIASYLGKPDDAQAYADHAERLKRLINDVFWDETDGFYYDRNEKTGERVRVKSIAGFFPLWAGVATPERAGRLVREHLTNPNEFWLKYPIATYAKTEPDYYQGSRKSLISNGNECNWRGSAWMPMNYIVFHGLMRYGFSSVAHELALRSYRMALEENPNTREWFNAETGAGEGHVFWGFSTLGYVMPLEWELGYDPMDVNGPVKPIVTENLGIAFPTAPAGK